METTLEALLATAFTKVAHQACRQGEKGERQWPPLSELPEPESWRFVGEKYAHDFLVELLGNHLKDLLKPKG